MRNIYIKSFFISTLFLLLSISTLHGRDIKILAIGNSFSEDAVEQYLYELAAEGGDNLIIGNAYRGGQGLKSHWEVVSQNKAEFEYRKVVRGIRTNSTSQTLLHCLLDEDWDYITFQQVSSESGLPLSYEPWLSNLVGYVKQNASNSAVQFAMHRTWAYAKDSNHDGFANYDRSQIVMFEAIVAAVNAIVANHDDINIIIPAGTAIQNGRTSFIGDNFCRDGYHLSYRLGRYTAACTWLEVFTGQSAVGKTWKPSAITEVEALVAQKAAHAAVINPNAITLLNNIGFDGDNTIQPNFPINVNFGINSSLAQWNNLTPTNKYILGLNDLQGNPTEMLAFMDDEFNGVNGEGVQNTNTSLNMPNDVSSSCVWGFNRGVFGSNVVQPTGRVLFGHLNKDLVYDFHIFASRKDVTDYRDVQFNLQGEQRKRAFLNASNNGTQVLLIEGIRPSENGDIRLTVSPGVSNNNPNWFYYLNAIQITTSLYNDGSTGVQILSSVPTISSVLTKENLKISTSHRAVVSIIDLTGHTLDTYRFSGESTISLNYPNGLYFVRIDAGKVNKVNKIIINK